MSKRARHLASPGSSMLDGHGRANVCRTCRNGVKHGQGLMGMGMAALKTREQSESSSVHFPR